MQPVLFHLFGIPFHAHRVFVAIAVVVCTLLSVRESRLRNLQPGLAPELGMWVLFGALLGARALYVLEFEGPRNLWHALMLWDGGLIFFGGLAGGAIAATIHLRKRKTPILKAADIMAPYLALGEAIARVGCFFNGCCYGITCAYPWAMRFRPGSVVYQDQLDQNFITASEPLSLPCHPTQLYLCIGLVAAYMFLKWRLSRKSWDGAVACHYLLLYGILRFLVEMFRGDSEPLVGGLGAAQLISALLMVAAVTWMAGRRWVSARLVHA